MNRQVAEANDRLAKKEHRGVLPDLQAEIASLKAEVSALIARERTLRDEVESANRHATHALQRNKENAERAEANKQAFIKADYERLRAEDRVASLRAYVQHRPNCAKHWSAYGETPCTCGLAALVEGTHP